MGIVIAILVLLLVLMYLGWRARRSRQSGFAQPKLVPSAPGAVLGTYGGKYVATTTAGDPLDRVAVHGLGFRSAASLTITDGGVIVSRTGSTDFWIPAQDVQGLDQATWTIDRVVEEGGLERVRWTLGDREVDTYLRLDEPAAFEGAVERILVGRAS
jgi:hypothetical protein